MELGHWVTGSFGSSLRRGHPVTGSSFWPGARPEFSRFSKKCPKCKAYIWNAEITKVIVRCLLLDWNHWMSIHAMNFYVYLWLLQIRWPENTSTWRRWRHCSHTPTHKLTFGVHYRTGSPGQLHGSPGRWIPGSLGRWVTKCDPVPCVGPDLQNILRFIVPLS